MKGYAGLTRLLVSVAAIGSLSVLGYSAPVTVPALPATPTMDYFVGAQIVHSSEPDEYPEGQYCTPKGDNFKGLQTPENPCSCHIVMRPDKEGCCEIMQANDAQCKQFCHEHHCSCPHECLPPDPDTSR